MKISYRPLTKEDLPDRVRWFSDPEVAQYLGSSVRNGTTLASQRKWFKKQSSAKDRRMFAIEVDEKMIGNVGLSEIEKDDANAGIFIVVGDKNFWGVGVATDALKFITNYGFKRLKLHKIWLHVFEPNIRAVKLYEKFGFIKEGHHTEMLKLNGKFHDEIFMSLTNPADK
jgi:RimJ/RimL family protein N-acetyltransferase